MIRSFALLLLLLSSTVTGFAKEKYQHAGPIHLDRDGEKWAEKTLQKLSLEEKVGQLERRVAQLEKAGGPPNPDDGPRFVRQREIAPRRRF